jgi:hypothetical protein
MDNKNIIISILAMALVAVCVYLANRNLFLELENARLNDEVKTAVSQTKIKATTKKQLSIVTSDKTSNPDAGKSINDIVSTKEPTFCFYDGDDYSVKVFSANGQLAVITTAGPREYATVSNMVMKSGYQYRWLEGETVNAYKTNVALIAEESPEVAKTTSEFGMANKVGYRCQDWTVDNKIFTLPDNIIFTDNTERVKKMPTPTETNQK